jgi:hypothetical protein
VGFQRGVVLILLVNEETTRLSFVPVHLVHGTPRLFPGMFG